MILLLNVVLLAASWYAAYRLGKAVGWNQALDALADKDK